MLPRSFYFVRHGETDWNKQGLIQGRTDIPLNETGRTQARRAVDILAGLPIDLIVTSDLLRAQETAHIINAGLKKPIVSDPDIRERNYGIFEGKSVAEMDVIKQDMIAQGLPPEENGYPCPREAESYGDFRARTLAGIARRLDGVAGQNILFVAHGGVYRVLRRCLFTRLDHSPNVQPYHFDKQGDDWFLLTLE
jgi:probable phosphoglycerate mutase